MGIESFYEKAKDADYIIYVWNLGGKPSTLSDFTGYNSILADIKAVKDGKCVVYNTRFLPDCRYNRKYD